MRTILIAAGTALAALSATAAAQGDAAPDALGVPAPGCYIEIQKLFGEPPAGIGDLGAALRTLDGQLRPQVTEINELKAQIARLEQRQAEPAANVQEAVFEEEEERDLAPALPADDPNAEELTRLQTQLGAKQDQLKLDYAAQQQALVGPVQTRVSQRAAAFATERGCARMKMARAPDLAELTSAGATNVTAEFVTWYLANPQA